MCICLCLGAIFFFVRTRYRDRVLHPAQTAESRSFSSPAVLPEAQHWLAGLRVSIHEMEPHELSVLSTLFKWLLVVANGYAEHF